MKEFLKDIKADRMGRFGFLGAFVLSILTFFYILIAYKNLPPFIPIFNQLPWGEARIGSTITIFIPVLYCSLIIVGNLFLANFIYKKIPLISRILAATSIIVALLIFLFTVKTVWLIT